MGIVTGMSIDKDEETGDYLVTMQIINPGEIASQMKTERLEVYHISDNRKNFI